MNRRFEGGSKNLKNNEVVLELVGVKSLGNEGFGDLQECGGKGRRVA